jgi:hypothetical protein
MNVDKGIIYKTDGDVHFAKWADVSEFTRKHVEHEKTTLLCTLFPGYLDFFCS